jgi:hypothetical protein
MSVELHFHFIYLFDLVWFQQALEHCSFITVSFALYFEHARILFPHVL